MTETDRKQIEAAKAAINKATPGPWEIDGRLINSESTRVDGWRIVCITHEEINQETKIVIAAAPALVRRVQELEDWQARALPWLKDEVYRREKLAAHIYKSCAYMPDGDFYTTDDLIALIAEAKE